MTHKTPRIFHLLQQAHSAVFRAADRFWRQEEGLTATQQGVLFTLSKGEGIPITTIADQLKMGKSSLTGLIDRMTERKLVRRETSAQDGRVQLIFIEPAGVRHVERSVFRVRRYNERLLEAFSPAEQQIIARFLNYVAHNADDIITNIPENSEPEIETKK
ncbi:MAG: MarR family winged helix-turn-helix transcriptional regulator [Parasphingorhabdus sp.]|uniref:MarR family winged helix-turn-helix transcriptional regulator n=1 Tax=Parasphingorhabdus sp. TaxID=2709688 RepID=UPI0032998DA9